nr:hypothetical protein [Providencia stuartii]ELR5082466.1 hypothetical protein [Providencia stuartii]
MKFSVLVTFDLKYCKKPEYTLVQNKLAEMGFCTTSHRSGLELPSNTYLGVVDVDCHARLTDMAIASTQAVNEVYSELKAATKDAQIESKIYAIASPYDLTKDSCSR